MFLKINWSVKTRGNRPSIKNRSCPPAPGYGLLDLSNTKTNVSSLFYSEKQSVNITKAFLLSLSKKKIMVLFFTFIF